MVMALFFLGFLISWSSLLSDEERLLGAIFQFIILLIGLSAMVGAMYLRHLGW